VISAALEMVLVLAHREAVHRRHGHLTLEHLLFAAAHHPSGEEILRACGADLQRLRADLGAHLEQAIERLPQGADPEPVQTVAFRRVLEQTILHLASAGRNEAGVGDAIAALLTQTKTFAAQALDAQGITRLDVLNFISHGVSKVPPAEPDRPVGQPERAGTQDSPRPAADPLAAFTVDLTERARAGALDPLVGRQPEIARALEVLCRRRKNNPVFVGESGVG
jgi:ATP-dependent Clp protease ATP-binding subunit ClpA